ncbi:hypothetical protein SAMN05421823_107259 [Catalinimonas alkaloidigena]|uniref:DUF6787 domain-containing protein n=1 Tax=Catalinimonas alkaloidigena TaxID=1075417 RepID=A0A1G9M4C0_9BACT|nr:DUF6787 family protein [Catalinimonas alkaloidigena]SDL69004.1 hypothetical protein SAMN05421823_107259 [Catalinimonas alkaloidigena]
MAGFLRKMQERWGVDSLWQVVIIFVVFALTGSTSVYVRRPVFEWLGITSDTPLWITIPAYLLVIFPTYQVLLLLYGTLLGQFRFFWGVEKKMLQRLRILPKE